MKKIAVLLFSLLFFYVAKAQSIVIAGGCVSGSVTLTQIDTLVNGNPAYKGTGTVGSLTNVEITILWLNNYNVWAIAYGGQPYYSNACATGLPPGTANGSCPWTSVTAAPCSSPAPLSVTGNVALSVAFGSVSAHMQNSRLHVNWSTITEANSDHFEIEGSADGEVFKTIATVNSKAGNGESKAEIAYDWASESGLSLAWISYAGILMLLWFSMRRKWKLVLGLAGAFILLATPACKKQKEALGEKSNYFIRVAQVDKDGTRSLSKIVQVVQE